MTQDAALDNPGRGCRQEREEGSKINRSGPAGCMIVVCPTVVVKVDVAGPAAACERFKNIVKPGVADIQHKPDVPAFQFREKIGCRKWRHSHDPMFSILILCSFWSTTISSSECPRCCIRDSKHVLPREIPGVDHEDLCTDGVADAAH